jgi:hypothetical protein
MNASISAGRISHADLFFTVALTHHGVEEVSKSRLAPLYRWWRPVSRARNMLQTVRVLTMMLAERSLAIIPANAGPQRVSEREAR